LAKKFIENIQKLIDNKDPIRNVGNVSTGRPQSFKFEPVNLVAPPLEEPVEAPEVIINPNLIWFKSLFQFDRGNFFDLSLSDFNTALFTTESQIVSNNGNFQDLNDEINANVMYQTSIRVTDATDINLTVIDFQFGSLAVIIKFLTDDPIKVFTSGPESRYVDGIVSLPISKAGFWTITILTYHQKTRSGVRILGNLGSYVTSTESPEVIPPQGVHATLTRGNKAFESVFVDGANGPTLSNIIYWDRFSSSSSIGNHRGGPRIKGYGLYHVVNERLGFDVVSGWGTDAFVVSGSQLPFFPTAGTLGIPGPIAVTYQVSGTFFDTGADRTIVTVSGTNFLGAKFDSIYIERTLNLTDITQDSTSGDVISGTHFNVKAGDLYTYEVDTFNAAGRGPRSIRISGTAGDLNPPGLVTSLAGTGSLKAIRLTWSNPTDTDLKGIHVFDTDTVVSGTTKPIKTIIKGSNTTIPECTVVTEVSSGTLIDQWPYKLYVSTFDHAGNESTEAMPTVTVTTDVEIKTSREGQRIETDTSTNQLRFFDVNDNEILNIGENIDGTRDGVLTHNEGIIKSDNIANDSLFQQSILGIMRLQSNNSQSVYNAIAGVINTSSATGVENTFGSAIKGTISDADVTPPTDGTFVCIHGDYSPNAEGVNGYSGYFEGAKVFIEKNLIVSGTTSHFSGNLGIGLSRTEGTLHVHTATAGSVTANASLDDLVVENSGDGGVSILLPNTARGFYGFGDEDDNFVAGIDYDHSVDSFRIFANNSEKVTINSDGTFAVNGIISGTTSVDGLAGTGLVLNNTLAGVANEGNRIEFINNGAPVCRIDGETDGSQIKGKLRFSTSDNGASGFGTRMLITSRGNTLIGTSFEPTANDGKVLVFGDNAADPTMDGDTAAIYGKAVSSVTEMFAIDEGGTASQLTPHNKDGEWIHFCINRRTGKVEYVNMKKAFKLLEKLSGKKLYHEIDIEKFKDPNNISSLDAEKLITKIK